MGLVASSKYPHLLFDARKKQLLLDGPCSSYTVILLRRNEPLIRAADLSVSAIAMWVVPIFPDAHCGLVSPVCEADEAPPLLKLLANVLGQRDLGAFAGVASYGSILTAFIVGVFLIAFLISVLAEQLVSLNGYDNRNGCTVG